MQKNRYNVPAPDLSILTSFVTVAELLNFTHTAEKLNHSQSTISLHIRRVEEIYNCQVFSRSKRSVVLTPDGEVLLGYAQRILSLHDAAQNLLHKEELDGDLSIGVLDDVSSVFAQILYQFSQNFPKIKIELHTAVSSELIRGIECGRFDAIVTRHMKPPPNSETIWQEPLVWVAAPDFKLAEGQTVPLVLYSKGCQFRPVIFEALAGSERSWVNSCTSSSLSGITASVEAGFGLTALPQRAISKGLIQAPVNWNLPDLPNTTLALQWHENFGIETKSALRKFLIKATS